MCTLLRHWFVPLGFGSAIAACAGGITLPDNGFPASLRAVSGNGQEGTIGSRLDAPLIVRVTDVNAQPVAGVAVVFRFQSEDPEAEVSPTEAATDSDGLAEAEVRLGAVTGAHIVEASVAQSAELRATFAVIAVAPEDEKDDKPEKGGKDRGRGGGNDDKDDDDHDDDDDDD